MRIFQLKGIDDEDIGLFHTERDDDSVGNDIANAYDRAKDTEDHYLESDEEDAMNFDIHEEAESILYQKGIHRFHVEEIVYTDVI